MNLTRLSSSAGRDGVALSGSFTEACASATDAEETRTCRVGGDSPTRPAKLILPEACSARAAVSPEKDKLKPHNPAACTSAIIHLGILHYRESVERGLHRVVVQATCPWRR